MGVVYRGTRADTGLEVAVKLMLPELSSNIRFRERFIAEARTAPKLDHPNIVPVYEAGGVDSELYIAMRLVHGPDLKQVIEREGKLTPQRVVALLRQASAALDYAHGTGVVHRDVKPQNILLSAPEDSSSDGVYITDFGLVKPAGSESTASRSGEVFGSIQYMAPEQIESMPTDGRADVYSLGCVAFEALTGAIPFDRANEVAVLWAHVHDDPPRVTDVRPGLPGGLDIAVANALAKHPDDRYLTCGEFAEALEQGLATGRRPVTMPLVRPLVKRIPRMKTEREVWAPNFFPELSRVRKLTNKPNWVRILGLTGALLVLIAGSIQFGHPQGLAGAAEDVAGAAETIVTAVTDSVSGPETASSELGKDDGDRQRAAEGRAGILDPNQREQASAPIDRGGQPLAEKPQLETRNVPPDEIVFVSGRGFESEIYKTDPEGGGVKRLTDNDTYEFHPSWSADGKRIAFGSYGPDSSTEIWVMRRDGSDQRLVLDLGTQSSSDGMEAVEMSWSPDSKRLVYSFQGIYVVNLDGSGKGHLAGPTGASPEWSPDGEKIVFANSSGGGSQALWIMNPDGSGRQQVTEPTDASGGTADWDPTWTPDGDQIAFSRGGLGVFAGNTGVYTNGIFVVDADGSDLRRVSEGRGEFEPSSSPSGDRFVYRAADGDLYLIGSDGSDKRRLTTNGDNRYPDWRWPPT
jgi:serine/threonine-protein kinase